MFGLVKSRRDHPKPYKRPNRWFWFSTTFASNRDIPAAHVWMQLCSCPCISSRWSTRALHGFRDVLASSKLGFADARWISTIQRVRRQGANAIETTKPSTNSAASSLHGRSFRLAVIGAGPAGFYATSRVLGLAESDNARVDMYEELPVPFGLVRYGVAPDHPEVKVSGEMVMPCFESLEKLPSETCLLPLA